MCQLESTIPCPPSPGDLLQLLQPCNGNSTAIDQYVNQTCPGVRLCDIIYGYGNADLAGIGLYVSYIAQRAILLISAMLYVASNFGFKKIQKAKRTPGLQTLLADTTAYFALGVVVSGFVRLYQTPAVDELDLISSLVSFEVCVQSFHVFTVFSVPVSTSDPTSIEKRQDPSIVFHIFCLLLNAILGIPVQLTVAGLGRHGERLQQLLNLVETCGNKIDLKAGDIRGSSSSGILSTPSCLDLFPFAVTSWLLWMSIAKTRLGVGLVARCNSPGEMSKKDDETSSSASLPLTRRTLDGSSCNATVRIQSIRTFIGRALQLYANSFTTLWVNDQVLLRLIMTACMHFFIYRLGDSFHLWISLLVTPFILVLTRPFIHIFIRFWNRRLRSRIRPAIAAVIALQDGIQRISRVYFHCNGLMSLISGTLWIWVIIWAFGYLRQIEWRRDDASHMVSEEHRGLDIQNEWGVGQVAAIVAWVPLVIQMLFYFWHNTDRKSQIIPDSEAAPVHSCHALQCSDQSTSRLGLPKGIPDHQFKPVEDTELFLSMRTKAFSW